MYAKPIRIEIPGEPVSKGRPRYGKGRTYTPAKTVKAEEAIRWEIKRVYREEPLTGRLDVEIRFYVSDNRRRDLDNLAKLVLDSANNLLWDDDSLIDILYVHRHVSGEPCTIIEVREI